MRSLLLLFCIGSSLIAAAQKVEPIPITKDGIMKFKTFSDALGLPSIYPAEAGTIVLTNKEGTFMVNLSGPTISEQILKHLFPGLQSGDKVTFENVDIVKDGRHLRLLGKVYVIK